MNELHNVAGALKYLVGAAVIGGLVLGLGTAALGLVKVFTSNAGDMVFAGWIQTVVGVALAVIFTWNASKAGKVVRRALDGVL